MTYELAENILLIVGLIVMGWSMYRYFSRTKDKSLIKKIWFGKLQLTKNEYLLNRIGLYLVVMGIAVRFINNLYIA
ncbi:MAG: hypothetical protein CMF31_05715 [Kordiimonas sp.]|nr:hypothetical protein [Kordiimonas sp.]|tara:strand:- start:1360 stop:1587 length:228 start_codon:yes stop_codon:yes gene_type:complete